MAMMGLLLRNFGTDGLPCYFSILSVQKFNVLPSSKLVSFLGFCFYFASQHLHQTFYFYSYFIYHRGTYFNVVGVSLGENGELRVGVR
ncbi:hypothetical protein CsSME_00031906 [Camellia sinensis var. sinensis]